LPNFVFTFAHATRGSWGFGGGAAGGGVSPHMPLTGQKRKLCLMALPATACLLLLLLLEKK